MYHLVTPRRLRIPWHGGLVQRGALVSILAMRNRSSGHDVFLSSRRFCYFSLFCIECFGGFLFFLFVFFIVLPAGVDRALENKSDLAESAVCCAASCGKDSQLSRKACPKMRRR